MPWDPIRREYRADTAPRERAGEKCPACQEPVQADSLFCQTCGKGPLVPSRSYDARDPQDVVICPNNGEMNREDANYCDQCGSLIPRLSKLQGDSPATASSGRRPGTSAGDRQAYLRGERSPGPQQSASRLALMRDWRPEEGPRLVHLVAQAERLVKRTRADLDMAASSLTDAQLSFPDDDLAASRHLVGEERERYQALRSAQSDWSSALQAHEQATALQSELLAEFRTAYPPLGR